jgi:hypothetical protein
MSKEIREMINKVKNFNQFINENIQEKLSFLSGKPINLIKTLHTIGKWNDEKKEMDKITRDEELIGVIGKIGDFEGSGYEVPGFWVMSNDNKKLGFVMYDKKSDKFVEGNSMYHYTYTGQSEKDNRMLQLFKDNLS